MTGQKESNELTLGCAAAKGHFDALKALYKINKCNLASDYICSATSLAISNGHFDCVKYLIDNAWASFPVQDKVILAKMATREAAVSIQKTQTLALLLKKFTPTLPEGTVHELKQAYPKAFENLEAVRKESLNQGANKPSSGFTPMYKKLQDKPVVINKPLAMVNLLEDCEPRRLNTPVC
jgi:hypothetical protein